MSRYVILEHDHPVRHWDLMIEHAGVLRTWRLEAPPQPGVAVAAEPTFDHRLVYLDYEGPISGGRGTVQRWDRGICTWEQRDDAWTIHFCGGRLAGTAQLAPNGPRWTFLLAD
jgi:hypothetical protein